MVDADGFGGHADVPGELSDGEHGSIVDLVLRARLQDRGMTDWDTLRTLADEGNEKALDKLADLADERDDTAALSELLDEGCERAGEHLTRRAAAAKDLLELQRIRDAGYDEAGEVLDQLLG
ncbi:hypothetical protein GCM10009804_13050 [Kribbella hippodromi]|uniref:Uncharacterized protein n=2 Tax=Kribbella hippodromi TaxID=434347 RepID=A0ABN2CFF7_9ACTN